MGGVLSCLGAVFAPINGFMALSFNVILGVISFILAVPVVFLGYTWFKWLRNDGEDERVNVAKWMKLSVLLCIFFLCYCYCLIRDENRRNRLSCWCNWHFSH